MEDPTVCRFVVGEYQIEASHIEIHFSLMDQHCSGWIHCKWSSARVMCYEPNACTALSPTFPQRGALWQLTAAEGASARGLERAEAGSGWAVHLTQS